MSKRQGPLSFLKEKLLHRNDNQNNKRPRYVYVLIVGLFGVVVMLVSNNFTNGVVEKADDALTTSGDEHAEEEVPTFKQKGEVADGIITAYEESYEQRVKTALENIVGVNDVTVVVNVDATNKNILEKNIVTQSQLTNETDREGGKRQVEDQSRDEQVVIIRNGDKEVPIILETKKPDIRGVLIVAQGAENIQVKKWIIEAVTRVLDVPSHRVAVMPRKSKGE